MVDSYDSVGNRTGRTKDGTVITWSYDDGYRLVSQIWSGFRATFIYDGAGNATTKWQQGEDPSTMAFDAANRITTLQQASTLWTFTYDNNGNPTVEFTTGKRISYGYDNENRLVSLILASGTRSTYQYNGDGQRMTANEANAGLVTFIWDGDDYLMEKN